MNSKTIFSLMMGVNLGIIFLNIPPALETLMALYGVSYTRISLLISAMLWSHALMQVPGGMIVDRAGVRHSLMISLISMAAGNLLPVIVAGFDVAILARIITGIGTGLAFIATMKLLALYAPEGRSGSHQAFFAGAFSLGGILAYLFIPRLIANAWEWTYIFPELFCFPLIMWLSGLGLEKKAANGSLPPLYQVLKMPLGWIIGIYHALSYGSMLNLGNWMPSLLAETWVGASAAQLAWGGALVMLISGLGRIGGGFVIMKFRSVRVANGSVMILALIFLGLFVSHAPVLVLVLAVGAALFSSINFGAFFEIATVTTPQDFLATLFGFINFVANMGAIILTVMFGILKDSAGTFSPGFGMLALLCLGALLMGAKRLNKEVNGKE